MEFADKYHHIFSRAVFGSYAKKQSYKDTSSKKLYILSCLTCETNYTTQKTHLRMFDAARSCWTCFEIVFVTMSISDEISSWPWQWECLMYKCKLRINMHMLKGKMHISWNTKQKKGCCILKCISCNLKYLTKFAAIVTVKLIIASS